MMRALIFALVLTACASPEIVPPEPERFLSQEQDEEIRGRCAVTGCAIVPMPVWRDILRRLRGQGV
jgi:hypothetical protein